MKEQFSIPGKVRVTSIVLSIVGLLALIIGIFSLNGDQGNARFWGILLFNSVFFLLIVLGALVALCAATLAQGSWHVAYKRVIEAMVMAIPILGGIAFIVMMCVVWGDKYQVYEWVDKGIVSHDHLLQKKSTFLNPTFYTVLTFVTIGLWSFIGYKLRRFSIQEDLAETGSTKIFWKGYRWAAFFVAVFAITNSTSTWHWIMSIDPHWYSALFAWYIFASLFVTAFAVLSLFVIILRNNGYLEWVTFEHIHDLGKFMFAFSIFWTYLWFAQFILIWYGNIPEETTYFNIRMWGSYHTLFYLVLLLNFVAPFLILMTRDSKRNYTIVAYMALLVFIGHYLDFFMMFMPGIVENGWHLGWYEIGISLGFIGVLVYVVMVNLKKAPLLPKNNPYLKEAFIHES